MSNLAARFSDSLAARDAVLTALVVGYHYPPFGGVGAQRAIQLTRYLGEFAVRPVVLTGPGQHGDRWKPDDPTLLTDLGDVLVVRAPGPVPVSDRDLEIRLDRLMGRRSAFARWWIESIERLEQPPGQKIDVVLGELAPFETAFGVEKLAGRLGVPWVADLQDPWALDEMRLYPTVIQRLADRARMGSTLRTAAAVVMNTPEASKRLLEAFPDLRERRVVSITNAFDAEDFTGVVPRRARWRLPHRPLGVIAHGARSRASENGPSPATSRRHAGSHRRFSDPFTRLPHASC